ncbi:MAG: hypothetical protein JHC98_06965 [Thermoleophilaceae bacterium]|nr:hypothetical protein [Thermoleophilaceae bacterium]
MMKNSHRATGMRRGFVVSAVLALTLALAAAAHGTVREVGAQTLFTAPTCENNTCQVLTRTTVFQLKVGNRANVSRVPRDGNVVAYTLYLPSVVSKFYTYFSTTFNGAPTARVSILRRTPRKGVTKYRYTLVGQSEKLNVKRYLGGAPTFALAKPLPVKRGDVIALTTDSWIPNFILRNEDLTSTWRSSRPKGKCSREGTDITNLTAPTMHETINQIKQYNCGFTGARVLYHATVVDTPTKTNPAKK